MEQSSISNNISNRTKIPVEAALSFMNGQWMRGCRQFCTDHKEIIISGLALSIFLLWARRGTQDKPQNNKQKDKLGQDGPNQSVVKHNQNVNKNEVDNLQKLLEEEQLEQKDPEDKLFFYIQQQYRNDNTS